MANLPRELPGWGLSPVSPRFGWRDPHLTSVRTKPTTLALAASKVYQEGMNREVRLRGLSSDHHRSLVLVRHIREALKRGGSEIELCAHVAGHYDAELEPHFRAEEELLLPELTSGANRELAERTLSEHHLLRSQIASGIAGDLDALRALADTLEAHVRFEERELYPACEVAVPQGVLAQLAERVPLR